MPYDIIKKGGKYYVENSLTHRKLSIHPLSKEMARKQQIAVALSEIRHHPEKELSGMFK